jgi:hypothetical protein
MKTFLLALAALALTATMAMAQDVSVKGYMRDSNHDGVKDTYVQPYHRTSPNNTPRDNYNSYPNTNPYTGRQGTEQPAPKWDWQSNQGR